MSEHVVLVAEPEASQRQIIEMLLLVHGFKVVFALNGREALGFLQDNTPQLVIAYTGLPQLSGYDLARKVRGVKRLRRTPVILVAPDGIDMDAARADARNASADLLLQRPLGDKNLGERALALIIRAQSAEEPPTRRSPARQPAPAAQPVLTAVSDGGKLDPEDEIAQLRKTVAELSKENADLRSQLTATGRHTSGGADVIADLRQRLHKANELIEEYRRKHPDLIDVKATGTFGGLFRRRN